MHIFPFSMLQLPQEWSYFPGLQGAQKGERATLLHLRQGRPHGSWLWSCQWAEVLLLRWVWPHPETLWQGEMLQVSPWSPSPLSSPRDANCWYMTQTNGFFFRPLGVVRLVTLLCNAVKPARLTATTVGRQATWQKTAPLKPAHNQCPLLPLLFFRLMVGCIIFSESSSLAKVWLIEASPRPVSLSTYNTKKGVKKYLSAFNTKMF